LSQEFIIKSQKLEDKINQLLPSQGGFAAGVDLSASTQIVPIVDLTESAEGSNVRQDLQTAFGYNNSNNFDISSSTGVTVINTTGYYRVLGAANIQSSTSGTRSCGFILNDGTTLKAFLEFRQWTTTAVNSFTIPFDFVVFLSAGKSLQADCSTNVQLTGSFRQIADIDGNLTPLT